MKFSVWASLLCVATIAVAQVAAQVGYVPGGYGYYRNPYYGYGGYWGGYGGWGAGSTPMGSYLSGLGQTIRAQGQYNLQTSQAQVNLENALSQDIQNQYQWTQTYFEMRKINQAYQESQRDPPLSAEQLAQMAHAAAPARLPSSMLDPVNGQIAWPKTLQSDVFAPDRETLDKLFSERALTHGAIGMEKHKQIRQAVDAAMQKLKDHIRDFDSRNYTEARNFLSSLGHEANFPTTAG